VCAVEKDGIDWELRAWSGRAAGSPAHVVKDAPRLAVDACPARVAGSPLRWLLVCTRCGHLRLRAFRLPEIGREISRKTLFRLESVRHACYYR
jgi:hypothetical protein